MLSFPSQILQTGELSSAFQPNKKTNASALFRLPPRPLKPKFLVFSHAQFVTGSPSKCFHGLFVKLFGVLHVFLFLLNANTKCTRGDATMSLARMRMRARSLSPTGTARGRSRASVCSSGTKCRGRSTCKPRQTGHSLASCTMPHMLQQKIQKVRAVVHHADPGGNQAWGPNSNRHVPVLSPLCECTQHAVVATGPHRMRQRTRTPRSQHTTVGFTRVKQCGNEV